MLGQGIEMAGLQKWASILLGIALIFSVIFPVLFKGTDKIDRFFYKYAGKLIGKFRKLFKVSSFSSLWTIGFLNGFLPCGLVYVAIAGAINTNNILSGALYMIIFGLGTIPIMATIPIVGNLVGTNIRRKFKGIISVFIIVLGILFILRRLSLGIPYISPGEKMLQPHKKMMMHKKNNEMTNDTVMMPTDK
jgi:sulfite exporter TauE/SafE